MGDLVKYSEDMSTEERVALQAFLDNGCPGLIQTTEADILKWFRLYMSGKSYLEISKIVNKNIDLILYMSYKSKWNEKKIEYYQSLIANLSQKTQQVALDSANTVAGMVSALNKYYGDTFNKYLTSNDPSIIEGIDTKLLSQYYKSLESLNKLISPKDNSKGGDKSPAVNINLFGNAELSEGRSEGSERIVSEDDVGSILSILAQHKRKKEGQSD